MLDTKYVIKRSQSSETRLGLEKGTTVSKETAAAQERWGRPTEGLRGEVEPSSGRGARGRQHRTGRKWLPGKGVGASEKSSEESMGFITTRGFGGARVSAKAWRSGM